MKTTSPKYDNNAMHKIEKTKLENENQWFAVTSFYYARQYIHGY